MRGFGLRLLLLRGRPLHRVVNRDQRVPLMHLLAFRHEDPGDGPRDLGVDVDVLALRLGALDDAVGVDAVSVRVGRGREDRRLRLGLLTEEKCAHQRQQPARTPEAMKMILLRIELTPIHAVILPSSMRMMRSANS